MRTATACPEPPEREPAAVRIVCWPLTVTSTTHAQMLARWRDLTLRWSAR